MLVELGTQIRAYEYNISTMVKTRTFSSITVVFLQGLPDPDVVASSVQQMWVLTEMVQNNSTSARVGRFDASIIIIFLQLVNKKINLKYIAENC